MPIVASRLAVPLACGAAALGSAGAAVVFSLHGQAWNTSSLVRMHDTLRVAKLAVRDDPRFVLRHGSGFYDGAYFYAIARDPLATGRAHDLLREAPYYWGHPGYSWVAWLFSGGGRPREVPGALLAAGLLAIAVAGAFASLLARGLGWTHWGGLAVALNPGLVFSVANDTSEPLGAALILGALVAYVRGRRTTATVLFAALCLVKEPLVLVPLLIGAWELWRRRRPLAVAAVAPAALWWLYLRIHLGAFPFGSGESRLAKPFVGWWRAAIDATAQSWNPGVDTAQLGQVAVPLVVVVLLAILVGAGYALRLRTVVQPAYLALAALYVCITSKGVQYPKDLIRELAVVLALLPFAFLSGAAEDLPASARTRPPARPSSAPPPGS